MPRLATIASFGAELIGHATTGLRLEEPASGWWARRRLRRAEHRLEAVRRRRRQAEARYFALAAITPADEMVNAPALQRLREVMAALSIADAVAQSALQSLQRSGPAD